MIELQYVLGEKDLMFFNAHQMKKSERIRKTMNRHQATIPAFLGVIGLFVWFYYQDSLTAAWIGLSAVLWGFGAPFFMQWNARRRIAYMYTLQDRERLFGEYTLRIEPDALVEISKAGESKIPWKEVLRIEPAKNYAFIFVDVDSAIVIPRKGVKKGDIKAFYNAAEEHIDKAS